MTFYQTIAIAVCVYLVGWIAWTIFEKTSKRPIPLEPSDYVLVLLWPFVLVCLVVYVVFAEIRQRLRR